jgi:putative ABC transport system ATP-binding protein
MNDNGIIIVNELTKHYEDGRVQALRGVTFSIRKGELVAIMGPSGSGKSTLLHLIGGLDIPSSGQIIVNGQDISVIKALDDYRSKTIGFIFQAFYLMPALTALENVQIPMFEKKLTPWKRRKKAKSLLELVGLKERVNHYPSQLSGGERQRVAIARSLANDPEILLADEPTGNLDSRTAVTIIELIKRINRERGLTVIIVTHDENIANQCARTIRLLDGKLVE